VNEERIKPSKRAGHRPEEAPPSEAHGLWLEENREAIEAYNEHVKQRGVFSAGLRGF
jgi:post-segregation antitoxin (ccd killing protein)